jgi:hypothetical protein
MISRKLLCAATLACLAPFAASAAEAHLSPNTNGGSGAMPSGYSTLYFTTYDADWAQDLKLPANPSDGDRVVLESQAQNPSYLDTKGTVFAGQVFAPIYRSNAYAFTWDAARSEWNIADGSSARQLVGQNVAVQQIPVSGNHKLTQVTLYDGLHAGTVELPTLAHEAALLVVSNRATWGTRISGNISTGSDVTCASNTDCGFVYDQRDGKWHAREGRVRLQATTSQLPATQNRWTEIVAGPTHEDIDTPQLMILPRDAVDGDVYRFSDPSNSNFYQLSGVNTTNQDNPVTLDSRPITLRYLGSHGLWHHE